MLVDLCARPLLHLPPSFTGLRHRSYAQIADGSKYGNIEDEADHRTYDESLAKEQEGCEAFPAASGEQRESVYRPAESGQIYLLSLQPGEGFDRVNCTIDACWFDNVPERKALLYCWGRRTPPAFVNIGNSSLEVTRSLKLVLAHLRWEDRPRQL